MFVSLSLSMEPSFQLFSLGLQIIDVMLGLDNGISWAIQFNPEKVVDKHLSNTYLLQKYYLNPLFTF